MAIGTPGLTREASLDPQTQRRQSLCPNLERTNCLASSQAHGCSSTINTFKCASPLLFPLLAPNHLTEHEHFPQELKSKVPAGEKNPPAPELTKSSSAAYKQLSDAEMEVRAVSTPNLILQSQYF